MNKKSARIALGGMFSALCVSLMFMTGLVPFATYAFPMAAGAMLIPIVTELGYGFAVTVYISVSLLSAFVAPDKEAAMMFAVFFGYYPIAKGALERLPGRGLEYVCKVLLFNISVAGGFALAAYVLGMPEVLDGMGELGEYAAFILLGIGNVFFIAYDTALTRYYTLYVRWFKPRFLRR